MIAKVYKKDNGYQVYFNNDWNYYKTESDANQKAFELNYKYYLENKDKLPKGVSLDDVGKRFRLFIKLDDKTIKVIKSSKDLNLIVETRKYIIKNLLDLF